VLKRDVKLQLTTVPSCSRPASLQPVEVEGLRASGQSTKFSMKPNVSRYVIYNIEEQEDQHPLTGQRTPPISGGT